MSFSPFPRTVYKTKSKISGEIVVREQFGRYTLHVQNLIQSGGMIKGIWKKPLKKINKAERVLVLGLGGGTVVQLIAGLSARPHFCFRKKVKAQFSEAKITGVEIDKEIVKIGKKYFRLDEVENLEIINSDAIKWVSDYQGDKFDLILVDLYFGGEFPKKAMGDEFLKKLKKLLSKDGIVLFNWLKKRSERRLFEKLEKSFAQVEKMSTATNLFFFCY